MNKKQIKKLPNEALIRQLISKAQVLVGQAVFNSAKISPKTENDLDRLTDEALKRLNSK